MLDRFKAAFAIIGVISTVCVLIWSISSFGQQIKHSLTNASTARPLATKVASPPSIQSLASALNGPPSLHDACDTIMREGMIANGQEQLCGFSGNLHERFLRVYNDARCGTVMHSSETEGAASDVLTGMRNEYAQDGKAAFCKDASESYEANKRILEKQ